ncbi:MAG TPA: FliM/FliN family flagellar motor switch protein [Blastocatellia bacterium]|nr:FliM/FliN family flagellar motor switch protein [Blastocatellia bacterium]
MQSQRNIEMLLDLELPIVVRFGSRQLPLAEVLETSPGTIIELDKMADDPVAIFVNNKLLAKGEVVALDGHYGVKITEVISAADRVRSLG